MYCDLIMTVSCVDCGGAQQKVAEQDERCLNGAEWIEFMSCASAI